MMSNRLSTTPIMFIELAVLLICQLLGNWLVQATSIPLPGAVAGMVMMLVYLMVRGEVPNAMERISRPLLQHMSLFFIPAGAGVMLYVDRVADEWLAIGVALVTSTVITLLVTGFMLRGTMKRGSQRDTSEQASRSADEHQT